MPTPLFADSGSGMHPPLPPLEGGQKPLLRGPVRRLSQEALSAIGGILRHAAALLVRLLPKDSHTYETDTVPRVSTDAQGMAAASDLDRDREQAAFMIDPDGHAMALRDGFRPRGGAITLRLIKAQPVVVRAAFDDGEPAEKARAIRRTGWARVAPAGLFQALTGKWLPDGGLELPPMAPELFTFDISAFDRELAKSHRMSPSTHGKVLAGADLPKDRKAQLEPK